MKMKISLQEDGIDNGGLKPGCETLEIKSGDYRQISSFLEFHSLHKFQIEPHHAKMCLR